KKYSQVHVLIVLLFLTVVMSEYVFSYVRRETKVFDTSHENIQVMIEGINSDIAMVFLVYKNDNPDESTKVVFMNATAEEKIEPVRVKDRESYLVTWINNYELSVDGKRIFKLKQKKEQGAFRGLQEFLVNK
ncbi:15346_t:CDS:1, partial [Racocetra fulgida]